MRKIDFHGFVTKSLDFDPTLRCILLYPARALPERVFFNFEEKPMFEALLSNRTVSVLVEALPRILTAGLTMTIPLTLLSFFFAMIIAVAVALVQYANVPVLRATILFSPNINWATSIRIHWWR